MLSESGSGVGASWRPAVHALNIMRAALLDGALASDLQAYLAPAMRVAVRGFQSPSWPVRNSSMMVFAAVTSRAVGAR